MSLGTFVPLALTSTSCTSTNNPSHSDHHDQTSNVIPLNELQAQADTINTVDEAVEFMNQTFAKYYSFDLFQRDFNHAYGYYQKNILPNVGQVEYIVDIQSIKPNNDQRTIDFQINLLNKTECFHHIFTYQEDWTGYRIAFVPVLVNVAGVVKTVIACKAQIENMIYQEPTGDSPKLFCKLVQDDPDNLLRGQGGIMPGVTTCWVDCSTNHFNQKLIYKNDDDDSLTPSTYWSASNQDAHIKWFYAEQFPIQFSHLSDI